MSTEHVTDPITNVASIDTAPLKTEAKTFKQLYGEIESFKELTEQWVFYVPFVVHLLTYNEQKPSLDIVSALLRQRGGSDPLVVTTPREVFTASAVSANITRIFSHQLYAVPRYVWDVTRADLDALYTVDRVKQEACSFIQSPFDIPCPFYRKNPEDEKELMTIVYFSGYTNKLSFMFDDDGLRGMLPHLKLLPPLKDLQNYFNQLLQQMNRVAGDAREYLLVESIRKKLEEEQDAQRLETAAQQQIDNKLHEKINKPLEYHQLTNLQKEHAHDIIRQFREFFPDASE
jgi:hypothetical protein